MSSMLFWSSAWSGFSSTSKMSWPALKKSSKILLFCFPKKALCRLIDASGSSVFSCSMAVACCNQFSTPFSFCWWIFHNLQRFSSLFSQSLAQTILSYNKKQFVDVHKIIKWLLQSTSSYHFCDQHTLRNGFQSEYSTMEVPSTLILDE